MQQGCKKKVTIKDIAREAGISPAAVSLILNNKPCRILEEKKQLVREIAKRENYVVNQAAKSLATRKSHMLALILPDIENMFFSSLAKQIENRCRKEGYSLIIASSDDRWENDEKLLR
ncbi:MAG: LacI family transcriptional regulator, partial [Lachnospiraceae bacterium]|nr:LacI family transcriptional regulator [Lachnospiraceae bacterium]